MWLLVVSFSIYTHLRRYLYPQYIRTLLCRVVDGGCKRRGCCRYIDGCYYLHVWVDAMRWGRWLWVVKGIERREIESCVCNKKRISFLLPSLGYYGVDYVIYELVVRKGKRRRRRNPISPCKDLFLCRAFDELLILRLLSFFYYLHQLQWKCNGKP